MAMRCLAEKMHVVDKLCSDMNNSGVEFKDLTTYIKDAAFKQKHT